MLNTDMMEGPDNRPLQEAPDAFHGVGMDVPTHVFILGMVHGLMAGVMVANASVGGPFVGEDGLGFGGDVFQGYFVKGLPAPVGANLEYHLAAPLDHPDHQRLVAGVPLAHPFHLAANPGFVHLNCAGQKDPGLPALCRRCPPSPPLPPPPQPRFRPSKLCRKKAPGPPPPCPVWASHEC